MFRFSKTKWRIVKNIWQTRIQNAQNQFADCSLWYSVWHIYCILSRLCLQFQFLRLEKKPSYLQRYHTKKKQIFMKIHRIFNAHETKLNWEISPKSSTSFSKWQVGRCSNVFHKPASLVTFWGKLVIRGFGCHKTTTRFKSFNEFKRNSSFFKTVPLKKIPRYIFSNGHEFKTFVTWKCSQWFYSTINHELCVTMWQHNPLSSVTIVGNNCQPNRMLSKVYGRFVYEQFPLI